MNFSRVKKGETNGNTYSGNCADKGETPRLGERKSEPNKRGVGLVGLPLEIGETNVTERAALDDISMSRPLQYPRGGLSHPTTLKIAKKEVVGHGYLLT